MYLMDAQKKLIYRLPHQELKIWYYLIARTMNFLNN